MHHLHLHRWRDHLPQLRKRVAKVTRETRQASRLSVRDFAEPMGLSGQAFNVWERGITLPNPYLYFYAAEAGGPQARWAVRCLEALGLLPALKKLAEAADQYQHSTE